jgi:predicted permease
MLSDLRFAIRLLLKDRSFSLTALLTLAICIGANTAIFSIVRSVVLRPLPMPNSDQVVLIYNSYPNAGAPRAQAAVPDYFDRRERMTVFTEQALFRRQGMTYAATSGAERIQAIRATPSLFRLAAVQPLEGRIFNDDDGEVGRDRKVLLGYAFWSSRFGGDRAAIGRDIRLNGETYAIVGVLPKAFTFLWNDIDLFVPASFTPEEKSDDSRHSNNWTFVGRLRPGATVEQAQQQVNAVNAQNDERFPQFRKILKDAGYGSFAVRLQDDVIREVRPVLYLLWGGVLLVLLIGCVNIANLVLVRTGARAREMATRHAIGASVGRLGRQLLTESTLLAVTGAILGVFAGWYALRALSVQQLDQLPRGFEVALDPVSVALVLGSALVVGVLLGVMPIARISRMNATTALRDADRGGTSGRAASLLRRGLATAQVAIAFILLIGAGLLFVSFRAAMGLDVGFDPRGVVTAVISLPASAYKDDPAQAAFADRLLPALRARPGVEAAGVTSLIPFGNDFNSSVILAEGYVMKPGESLISPMQGTVSDGYFEAMKIPLVKGRVFNASDTAASTAVAIVDERLAEKFWPGQDPLGRRLFMPENPNDLLKITPETKFMTVVGVVKEVQMFPPGADFPPVGAYYFPFAQRPNSAMVLAVRTPLAATAIVEAVRKEVQAIDPALPVYDIQTMSERFDDALISRRLPMFVAAAFGVVALLLAAVGIYGVLAYGVAQRRREIGIRLALGSSTGRVFGLVLSDGVKMIVVGLLAGLAGMFAVAKSIEGLLFGVKPLDPLVVGGVAIVLAIVATAATLLPARRAARVNPTTAING